MTLRAYVVVDEPLAVERLLQETGRVEVVGAATVPEDAVAALTADPRDVCVLDIEMPRLNGFEVLARLPRQPTVVSTTAYGQYALRAFDVHSVDYLLEPVEPAQLERALAKIERLHEAGIAAQPGLRAAIEQVAATLGHGRPDYPDRIASRLGQRISMASPGVSTAVRPGPTRPAGRQTRLRSTATPSRGGPR